MGFPWRALFWLLLKRHECCSRHEFAGGYSTDEAMQGRQDLRSYGPEPLCRDHFRNRSVWSCVAMISACPEG